MARFLVAAALLVPVGAMASPPGPDPEEPALESRESQRPPPVRRARRRPASGPREPRAPRVVVAVTEGDSLSSIAAAHGVSVRRLAAENGIRDPALVRIGQRLRIPRARSRRGPPAPPCRNPAVPFLRLASNEAADVVLTRCNGVADPEGRRSLSRLARSLRADDVHLLHPRLLQLLQRVAKNWPGRRLQVISGYRKRSAPGHESNHTKGKALDFRIEGVSNAALRDFCRRFDGAGVGFYPNSVFVHLDVREPGDRAFWVDYSRPGEPPRYGPWPPRRGDGRGSGRSAANEAVRTFAP